MCGGNDHEHCSVPGLLLRNPWDEEPAPGQELPQAAAEAPRPKAVRSAVWKRRKLWELKRHLHCPVIGTCLDIDTWRRLARARSLAVEQMSDYEVHVHFVGACAQRNASSLAAQKALDRAHEGLLRRFARARSREQLEALWAQALSAGEVPGGFWALVSHPRCDATLVDRAYEDVHMLSHQVGAGQRADLKKHQEARIEIQRLRDDVDDLQRRNRQAIDHRDRRITALEAELAAVIKQHRAAQARESDARERLERLGGQGHQERMTAIAERARTAERRASRLRHEVGRWQEACERADARARAWEQECEDQRAQREALERQLAPGAAQCSGCTASSESGCPNLCGRRILCVGGRSHVIEYYRELVARCNGEFEHHDGGIEDNPQRLNALLSSADAVICTTDCVSHDAYNRSKKFCKRSAKPCVLLRSSGVSTFARALEQVALQHAGQVASAQVSLLPSR
ncbi:hypothetical protein TVNIR_0589 [Thioalkalivibrio nitratireducens DSM 14787]|uniref:DUF2325 domain-containing protein n=1 Tax=Thioalkalivibrio nitratireducens (strain DSM 14787 / UNIQEM 213 / ALEN2) TaxID=1255043 RepID=L0DTG5_THIND|nr:DUF2325 domain-containing protein [Thioalkalivibrio nitratireducens]AGA32290.1 hypothetical protein TVNIR_0589 [Thioalkalivibrio nitratireducens DSM 14787]